MIDMHPPTDRRCQIYISNADPAALSDSLARRLARCINEGTHWERWGGCRCGSDDKQFCESDVITWECDGTHNGEQEAR